MRSPHIWLGLALVCGACSDDPRFDIPDAEVCLDREDGTRYCIDVYEASRDDATDMTEGLDEDSPPRSQEGVLPWTQISWAGALAACESKGKRLCDREEWVDACDGQAGEGGNIYAYGNERDSGICNTDDGGAEPSGARAACVSAKETFDQSGNVREWTGNSLATAAARGGSWRSSLTHECTSGDGLDSIPPETESPEVGFRCCRDV